MAHRKTLSDLRTAIRDNLDEATASFWTNPQLLRFINRAKDRVWVEVRKLKDDYFLVNRASTDGVVTILSESYATSSFQIPTGDTFTRTLPPDFSEMKRIEVITSDYEDVQFQYRDYADPDFRVLRALTSDQTPSLFLFDIVSERTMAYAPRSNTALDLRIWYVQSLADLSADTDTMEIPHPLYLAVEAYATASAQIMDRDANAAVWEQRAKAYIAEMFGAHARQTQDPEFVTPFLAEWY